MIFSVINVLFIFLYLFFDQTSCDIITNVKYCKKSSTNNALSSCNDKAIEYVINTDDIDLLKRNNLNVNTQTCPSNPSLTCLSVDSKSLIGSGTYGLVVRAQSKLYHFPLAIKFIKLSSKIDTVSFNTVGRYNQIDRNSLIENNGKEKSLREAVALRLATEYDIPSIPKYITYLQSSSYRILVMELLEGYEELSNLIDKLSSKELLSISCQTAAIVCNLDRIGLSHDDMHERNILVNRKNNNKVYLIDFGGAHFNGKQGHFTSTSNYLKQPINLLGHVKRLIKENIIDNIQSQEKKQIGTFCSMMDLFTLNQSNNKDSLTYPYQVLFEKYWKIKQINKKTFKCA